MNKKVCAVDRNSLKLIAIIAMTIDHIAWALVPTPTILGQALHVIGRLTIVIMSMFIAEGFIYTKSYERYLGRLLLFAFISQPFYFLFANRNGLGGLKLIDYLNFNVLFSLSFALMALKLFSSKEKTYIKVIGIILLCVLSYYCDWCFFPILFSLGFYVTRENKLKKTVLFSLTSIVAFFFYTIRFAVKNDCSYLLALKYDAMMAGLLLGILPILLYNGKFTTKTKFLKWLFYVYYPLHLLVLWVIVKLV